MVISLHYLAGSDPVVKYVLLVTYILPGVGLRPICAMWWLYWPLYRMGIWGTSKRPTKL